jgi:hypothetical protein
MGTVRAGNAALGKVAGGREAGRVLAAGGPGRAAHGHRTRGRARARVDPDALEQKIAAVLSEGRAPTRAELLRTARAILNSAENDATAATEVDVLDGTYHTIVIDPSWPMPKIEREVRPNPGGLRLPARLRATLRRRTEQPCF